MGTPNCPFRGERHHIVQAKAAEESDRERTVAEPPRWHVTPSARAVRLLGFRLRPHLLDLLALTLDLLLLPLHLPLGLPGGVFLILHRIPDYIAYATAQPPTNPP